MTSSLEIVGSNFSASEICSVRRYSLSVSIEKKGGCWRTPLPLFAISVVSGKSKCEEKLGVSLMLAYSKSMTQFGLLLNSAWRLGGLTYSGSVPDFLLCLVTIETSRSLFVRNSRC